MLIKCLSIIVLISILESGSSSQCGIPAKSVSLIVKGDNFTHGKWPWMVALLQRSNGNKFFCGAVLVSMTKTVTAAHCIQDKNKPRTNTRDVLLKLGAYDLNNPNEDGVYSIAASEIIMHPDWNPFVQRYDADIAAITVEHDVPYTQFIRPICLASAEITALEGQVAGWGKSEDETKLHENIPKELRVPIWTNEHCFLESNEFVKVASKRTLCAGSRDGAGVCNGDSGGGLFVKSGGVFYLRGLVSASLLADGKCDVFNFALYTNVNKFIAWINVPTVEVVPLPELADDTCGVMSESTSLVKNGKLSNTAQWPWLVIIFVGQYIIKFGDTTYTNFEAGTLISTNHVIADGLHMSHVVNDQRVPVETDTVKFYFGVTNIDNYASDNSLILDGAEKITLHPSLRKTEHGYMKVANCAIVKLKRPVTFSQFIKPICLSQFNGDPYSLSGKFAYAVGLGYSETGGKTKDRKHAAMRIREKEICESTYASHLETVKNESSKFFCAGGDGGPSACWDDHPLYMKFNGRWYLHGWIQNALPASNGCRLDKPVLYELAGPYYQWIKNEIL